MASMTARQASEVIAGFLATRDKGHVPKDCMLDRLLSWVNWLAAGLCMIRDQEERIVPLVPNRVQLVIIATMLLQAARNHPVRQTCLKSRKHGVTTLISSLKEFLCGHYVNQRAIMLAHLAPETDEIFDISKTIAEKYTGVAPRTRDIYKRSVRYRLTNSKSWCRTAGGKGIGAGGTPNFVHLSEKALWLHHALDAEGAIINSVPLTPTSVIFEESTARGRNRFWEKWSSARAGKTNYVALFFPWYWDARLKIPVPGPLEYDSTEQALIRLAREDGIEIGVEAIQWRRMKIEEIGERLFKQEYPSTAEEAVEAAKGLVLPGLRECIVDELPFDSVPARDCGGGIDFGHADATAILSGFNVSGIAYLDRIWRMCGSLAIDRLDGLVDHHTYYCDPAALESREELANAARDAGKTVTLVQAPRTKGGRERDYVTAEWEMVLTLMRTGRLKIAKGCPQLAQLIVEADNLMWDENTGQPHMIRGETWGHFDTCDALRYWVMGMTRGRPAAMQPRQGRKQSRKEQMRKGGW